MKRNPAADYAMIVAGTFLIGFAIKSRAPAQHGYRRCVRRGHGCQGAVVCSSVADQYLLNIPLFAAGFFFCGWKFIKSGPSLPPSCSPFPSIFCPKAPIWETTSLSSALFGGIISGVGTGLVFLTSCTTGGTDLLAALTPETAQALYPGPGSHAGAGRA